MATIEERACISCGGNCYVNHCGFKESYVKGANDQLEIDIERACEVYRKELTSIIDAFNHLGKELYDIYELGELISLEGCVEDFRKAMDE